MGEVLESVAEVSDTGTRLDRFLAALAQDLGWSRGRVQDAVRGGLVTVDGREETSPSRKLKSGERVALRIEESDAECGLQPEPGPLDVLYSDERLAIVNKPAGLTTHPAPSCPEHTLVHRLLAYFPQLADMAALDAWRPGIVHRLDKDTSGLMVVALDEAARLDLSAKFAGREVRKVYLALVHGVPERGHGLIDLPMGRHPTIKTRMAVLPRGGREARSEYDVLYRGRGWSLLAVRIHTGRTHQIRVHLAAIGHSIIGDAVYGSREQAELCQRDALAGKLAARQMLHAHSLEFEHPDGMPVACVQEPPVDFRRLPLVLEKSVQRVGITGMPGSGKSTLLMLLEKRGVPCISADDIVAGLYAPGRDGALMIQGRFGGQYTAEDGAVDKWKLFAAMAGSESVRREVEALIHPLVAGAIQDFFCAHQRSRLAVAEVPLLVEAGWADDGSFDAVVGLSVDAYARREWLTSRRGLSAQVAETLESWHWPEEAKLAKCNKVVRNPGDVDGLAREVDALLERLLRRRVESMRGLHRQLEELMPGGPCGPRPHAQDRIGDDP